MTFGERITQLRKSRGLSRTQFAEILGIPQTTLRNYETNVREPGHSFIIQMANEFNVSTDYLLGVTEESEIIKTSEPDQDQVTEVEIERQAERLYHALLSAGYITEGQELTTRQQQAIVSFANLLSLTFNDSTE